MDDGTGDSDRNKEVNKETRGTLVLSPKFLENWGVPPPKATRLHAQELATRKESLTMGNVFAPQAQQLQTAISQELRIAAEFPRA